MHNLLDAERQKYEDMWTVDVYAKNSPGEMYAPVFVDMLSSMNHHADRTVLDAGCGSGKGAIALSNLGFSVSMCDLTDAGLVPDARRLRFSKVCLWDSLLSQLQYTHGGKFDFVYCCDVMEHIPTAFTMLVVSRLLEVARFGVFLSISFVPDVMGAWIGESLHETVQPFGWWRDNLNTIGRLVEARDLLNNGVFMVVPR